MSSEKIQGTDEAWDKRELGANEDFVKVADDIDISDLEKSVGLRMISIRMQESLIDDLKSIAKLHGLGYQPLIRQVLARFVESEKKRISGAKLLEKQKNDRNEVDSKDEDLRTSCSGGRLNCSSSDLI